MSGLTAPQLKPVDEIGNHVDFFQRKLYCVARHQGGTKPDEWNLLPFAEDAVAGMTTPHVVSSLTAGNRGDAESWHAPALDLDFHVRVDRQSPGAQIIEFALHKSLSNDDLYTAQEAFLKFKMADSVLLARQEQGAMKMLRLFFGDTQAHLVPSSTEDHYHLYINKRIKWNKYELFLQYLAEARIISSPYAEFSIARRATYLRYPGITKAYLPSPPSELPRPPRPMKSLS